MSRDRRTREFVDGKLAEHFSRRE